MAEIGTGAVDNLVKQFSSALDCLRELVQNSIDAGTPRVEVWMDYEPGEGHEGTISVHVDDFGEGMDESIIDSQLTQLFSSTKENDLTKIGKFGIGFVSVFALEPKVVLIQTGRGGEYWEVMFYQDKSFSKHTLDVPVEGTQVTIFKAGDAQRYRKMVIDARAALKKWCSQSETEVTFEDRFSPTGEFTEPEPVNEDFLAEGDCMSRQVVEGTEIVLSYNQKPVYGFYNRGLTLALTSAADQVLDQRAARYGHISLKIKSRYLEHTLSRETVLRDENYEKAMQILDRAADSVLFDALLDQIEAINQQDRWGVHELETYARLVGYLVREPSENWKRAAKRPILRQVDGSSTTPSVLGEAFLSDGRILVCESITDFARTLLDQGIPVLLGRPGVVEVTDALDLLRQLAARAAAEHASSTFLGKIKSGLFGTDYQSEARIALAGPEAVYIPVEIDEKPPAECVGLIQSAQALLKEAKTSYKRLTSCTLTSPIPDPPLFVVGRKLGPLMAQPPAEISEKELSKRPEAAVNRLHPQFEALLALSQKNPAMAAYCLAKDLLLSEDRLLEKDIALMSAALPNIPVTRALRE